MNLRDFASALTRSWLVIAAATVAGLTCGWVVGNSARTVYTTTSRVIVLASTVGSPEDAQQVTSLIRSEMSLYQLLAQGTEVTDRVASQVPGMTASEVAGATAATVTDQVITITVSLPSAEKSAVVAKTLANELANEIKDLHPGAPQLIRAEAVTAPAKTVSAGASHVASVASGGVLGLACGLIIVWGIASLRPLVASGSALAADGRLVFRAEADEVAFEQLAAVLAPHLKEPGAERAVLVGSGEKVNLGPWCRSLEEHLASDATTVTAAPNGADPITLRAVSGGGVTGLVVDRRDALQEVKEIIDLLEAAGAKLVVCLVVSEARA
jgi:hypothetical protein